MLKPRHKYIPNPRALFEIEDEEDETLNSFRKRFPYRRQSHSNEREDELKRQRQMNINKHIEIEKRTLESASRSLGLLYNTEDTAINTAQELIDQGDKLEKVNKTLDEMKPSLKKGQKHLNGIISVVYSLKKYVVKRTVPQSCNVKGGTRDNSSSSETLSTSMSKLNENKEIDRHVQHPVTHLAEFEHNQEDNLTRSEKVDIALDTKFKEMGNVIGRLKHLGRAMGEEIHEQNKLLDLLHDKVDDVEIGISEQNKQINKILNK